MTREEAEFISRRIGKVFPCADRSLVEIVSQDGKPKRGAIIAARRREIEQTLVEEGRILSYREMEKRLKACGHEVGSYVTVGQDYKAMGIESPRTTRLRSAIDRRDAQDHLLTPCC